MKKTFEIGPGLSCDVDRLVASRLLIQANSGGGKTHTLRRLLEQSHGRLQHLDTKPPNQVRPDPPPAPPTTKNRALARAEMMARLRCLARIHAANGGLTKTAPPHMPYTDRELAAALYDALHLLDE